MSRFKNTPFSSAVTRNGYRVGDQHGNAPFQIMEHKRQVIEKRDPTKPATAEDVARTANKTYKARLARDQALATALRAGIESQYPKEPERTPKNYRQWAETRKSQYFSAQDHKQMMEDAQRLGQAAFFEGPSINQE